MGTTRNVCPHRYESKSLGENVERILFYDTYRLAERRYELVFCQVFRRRRMGPARGDADRLHRPLRRLSVGVEQTPTPSDSRLHKQTHCTTGGFYVKISERRWGRVACWVLQLVVMMPIWAGEVFQQGSGIVKCLQESLIRITLFYINKVPCEQYTSLV